MEIFEEISADARVFLASGGGFNATSFGVEVKKKTGSESASRSTIATGSPITAARKKQRPARGGAGRAHSLRPRIESALIITAVWLPLNRSKNQ
jgi:hypothetical protein